MQDIEHMWSDDLEQFIQRAQAELEARKKLVCPVMDQETASMTALKACMAYRKQHNVSMQVAKIAYERAQAELTKTLQTAVQNAALYKKEPQWEHPLIGYNQIFETKRTSEICSNAIFETKRTSEICSNALFATQKFQNSKLYKS